MKVSTMTQTVWTIASSVNRITAKTVKTALAENKMTIIKSTDKKISFTV